MSLYKHVGVLATEARNASALDALSTSTCPIMEALNICLLQEDILRIEPGPVQIPFATRIPHPLKLKSPNLQA